MGRPIRRRKNHHAAPAVPAVPAAAANNNIFSRRNIQFVLLGAVIATIAHHVFPFSMVMLSVFDIKLPGILNSWPTTTTARDAQQSTTTASNQDSVVDTSAFPALKEDARKPMPTTTIASHQVKDAKPIHSQQQQPIDPFFETSIEEDTEMAARHARLTKGWFSVTTAHHDAVLVADNIEQQPKDEQPQLHSVDTLEIPLDESPETAAAAKLRSGNGWFYASLDASVARLDDAPGDKPATMQQRDSVETFETPPDEILESAATTLPMSGWFVATNVADAPAKMLAVPQLSTVTLEMPHDENTPTVVWSLSTTGWFSSVHAGHATPIAVAQVRLPVVNEPAAQNLDATPKMPLGENASSTAQTADNLDALQNWVNDKIAFFFRQIQSTHSKVKLVLTKGFSNFCTNVATLCRLFKHHVWESERYCQMICVALFVLVHKWWNNPRYGPVQRRGLHVAGTWLAVFVITIVTMPSGIFEASPSANIFLSGRLATVLLAFTGAAYVTDVLTGAGFTLNLGVQLISHYVIWFFFQVHDDDEASWFPVLGHVCGMMLTLLSLVKTRRGLQAFRTVLRIPARAALLFVATYDKLCGAGVAAGLVGPEFVHVSKDPLRQLCAVIWVAFILMSWMALGNFSPVALFIQLPDRLPFGLFNRQLVVFALSYHVGSMMSTVFTSICFFRGRRLVAIVPTKHEIKTICYIALAIFVYIDSHQCPWIFPLLIGIPMKFRESLAAYARRCEAKEEAASLQALEQATAAAALETERRIQAERHQAQRVEAYQQYVAYIQELNRLANAYNTQNLIGLHAIPAAISEMEATLAEVTVAPAA